jgi:hypothetical protein
MSSYSVNKEMLVLIIRYKLVKGDEDSRNKLRHYRIFILKQKAFVCSMHRHT